MKADLCFLLRSSRNAVSMLIQPFLNVNARYPQSKLTFQHVGEAIFKERDCSRSIAATKEVV